MKLTKYLAVLILGLMIVPAAHATQAKKKIFVVSSYHKSYLWSQSTQKGLTEAMLNYGYLDNADQAQAFTENDEVESSKAIIQKAWMDTKRRNSFKEIAMTTSRIMESIDAFEPDLVLLGDDNAANYIGNQLLDTDVPVVFWGINGLPLKYGLIESMDSPGHNVTGVWQAGYPAESLELLKRLAPDAETFAILACDSETSRPRVKQIQNLHKKGILPLKLVDIVITNSFSEFKTKSINLSSRVDAFV